MTEPNAKIEQRLQNMKNFYKKVSSFIDQLPDAIPEKIRTWLKDTILGDADLKNLMDGIESHRPPRIFLIGRTGVGKSSFINALCGSYVAKVSDTISCTPNTSTYQCTADGRVLMEILDTRGIAESESLDSNVSAEEQLIADINEFSPDVAVLMLNCTHRDDVNSDIEFLKKVAARYAEINKVRLPIVVVANKCDEVAPARLKVPTEYPESKINKINEIIQYYKGIIMRLGLKIDDIVAVSSLIDWQTPDGLEVTVEEIESLPQADIDNLQIAFDGRYGIDDLQEVLAKAMLDFDAQMGLRMAARLDEVVRRVSKHLTKIFSGISAGVAVTPIPVSDIYILLVLQVTLVMLIASLSGRDVSFDTAKEFIFSVSGIAGAGYALKVLAQQAAKLIPGCGSLISSGIASTGTWLMGKTAISYYIDGKSLKEAKKIFDVEKAKINSNTKTN